MTRHDGALTALRWYLRPLQDVLGREDVTDVVVNRPGEIGVEQNRCWTWVQDNRLDLEWLESLARQLASFVNQDISDRTPILSAAMPGGERAQIVRSPAIVAGQFSLTIRKPPARIWSSSDLEEKGLFGSVEGKAQAERDHELHEVYRRGDVRKFLKHAVKQRKNIVISGATGSGKTTLARALLCHIPPHERLITGEDTHELRDLPIRNVVNLLYPKDADQAAGRISAKALMEAALRMRPDRVVFPELRDGTAYYFLRSVASGHPGVITTVHANNCRMAWEVLTLLVRECEGGAELERDDIRGLLRQTVDIIVQMKWTDAGPRVVEIELNDAYSGDADGNETPLARRIRQRPPVVGMRGLPGGGRRLVDRR